MKKLACLLVGLLIIAQGLNCASNQSGQEAGQSVKIKEQPNDQKQKTGVPESVKTTTKTVYDYSHGGFGEYQKIFKEKIVTEYENADKPLAETYYDLNGKMIAKHTYKYNKDYTGIKSVYKADGTLEGKYIYKYDNQWNKTEVFCYYPDGSLKEKWIYEYNPTTGNLMKSRCYKKEGLLSFVHFFAYKYEESNTEIAEYDYDNTLISKVIEKKDNSGNLIEKAFYLGDGTLLNQSVLKYLDDKEKHRTEIAEYRIEQKFGIDEEVPVSLTVYE